MNMWGGLRILNAVKLNASGEGIFGGWWEVRRVVRGSPVKIEMACKEEKK